MTGPRDIKHSLENEIPLTDEQIAYIRDSFELTRYVEDWIKNVLIVRVEGFVASLDEYISGVLEE